jgi:hypothetical protein
MVSRMRFVIGLALLCAACSKSGSGAPASDKPEETKPKTLLGVDPEKWTCTNIMSDAEVSAVLGGEVHVTESMMKPAFGEPKACSYGVIREATGDAGPPPEEPWMVAVSCREDYEKQAEILFTQYAQVSADEMAEYKKEVAENKGKPLFTDAGVELTAPEDSFLVQGLGKKALDHRGQGLIFIDDDSPCYVRIAGPDAAHRLAIAQLVAKNLHESNAPMKPHGKPVMK